MKKMLLAMLFVCFASTLFAADFSGDNVGSTAVSNDGTKSTIKPPTGDYLRVGDAGTTSHSLNANDDLLVSGELEVDGSVFLDGAVTGASTLSGFTSLSGTTITDGTATITGGVVSGVTKLDANAICAALPPGQTSNCGLTYADSTLSITAEDGSALSATNPCCVGVPGATAGQSSTIAFTTPISTTFGATSDTDGNTFGITSGVNWASDMPDFLHVCRGSASNYWGFSRNPARYETGDAAGDMCQEGDEDCDAQGDLFIMTTGLTLASEVDMPCVTVGAFRSQWTAASTSWAVSTLGDTDGIGQDRLDKTYGTKWTFPTGQMGGDAGKYFTRAGGTTNLAFTTYSYSYWLSSDGWVHVDADFDNQTAPGAGANDLYFALPLACTAIANSYQIRLNGLSVINGTREINVMQAASWGSASSTMTYSSSAYSILDENQVSGANDRISFNGSYQAFTN